MAAVSGAKTPKGLKPALAELRCLPYAKILIQGCMTLSIKSAPGLLSLFLFGPTLHATAQDAGAYTLEVNTQAVVLDVLVTDKHGHPVQGLHRDDFSIKEDRV